jgi:hypothetical protein
MRKMPAGPRRAVIVRFIKAVPVVPAAPAGREVRAAPAVGEVPAVLVREALEVLADNAWVRVP